MPKKPSDSGFDDTVAPAKDPSFDQTAAAPATKDPSFDQTAAATTSNPSFDDTAVGPSSSSSSSSGSGTPVRPSRRLATDLGLEVGERVGRYIVASKLGSGGMGVVLAAYDPELDRKVAIKLVRTDRGSDPEGL